MTMFDFVNSTSSGELSRTSVTSDMIGSRTADEDGHLDSSRSSVVEPLAQAIERSSQASACRDPNSVNTSANRSVHFADSELHDESVVKDENLNNFQFSEGKFHAGDNVNDETIKICHSDDYHHASLAGHSRKNFLSGSEDPVVGDACHDGKDHDGNINKIGDKSYSHIDYTPKRQPRL